MIYWTFIELVTTVHKSLSDTMSSSSDWTLHWNYSDFQLKWTELNCTELYWTGQIVKVKVTLRLTVSQSVSLGVETHMGLMTRYLLLLFDSYALVCGTRSLTRGRVSLLYMLLVLASIVFLGSEFLGTPDHILLSQSWDFIFVASYELSIQSQSQSHIATDGQSVSQ
jgi:hypothetical protein